ncbi:MAG TPA: hypothetical protein VE971_01325 [Candidatus Eisenbacteria bacterium]|nr:hypothetical protein [Candidatus Eisenbacteria bacterium]
MAPSKEFEKLCLEFIELHRKKNADYTQHNPFENFEKVAQLQQWFESPMDKAFVGLMAVKLARLAALLNTGKTPNNESVGDSFVDLCVYAILWAAYYRSMIQTVDIPEGTYAITPDILQDLKRRMMEE